MVIVCPPLVAVYLDLDGARHIYRVHGWRYDPADDPLFEFGLRGALDLLARAHVPATLFVVAEDVFDARKRAFLREAVAVGHEVVSYSFSYGWLMGLDAAGKRREIVESWQCLTSELGADVRGFRAFGFRIDCECLELVNESGYAYDSSMLAAQLRGASLPYRPLPGQLLYELFVPLAGLFSFPFHLSYSFVLGHWYFRAGLTDFRRRRSPLVLLFYLTDFADLLPSGRIQGWQQCLFMLSHLTVDHKRARCASILDLVRRHFTITSISWLLSECTNGSHGEQLVMKVVTQNLKIGKLEVQEFSSPILRFDGLLVRVRWSLISLGTERAVIAFVNKGPLGKVKDWFDLFRKVLNKAKQEGYWSIYKVVKNLMSTSILLGYSCAGDVLEVGAVAMEFHVGDRVVCVGFGHANHAEIDYVPRNLVVRMPDVVLYDDGCFVTVGMIALHGVWLAEIALGDRVVVLGLGLVGQIVAQLARCAGAMVIVFDIDPDKFDMARRLGAYHVVPVAMLVSTIGELMGGLGVDSVVLCAAAKFDELMRQVAAVSRLKGCVIVVGDVGMVIERWAFFEKELTLLVSWSYGSGRYDLDYELCGCDYPAAYVRWTEGRNMQVFLDLFGRGDVSLVPLVTHRFAIDEAESAYDIVIGKRPEPAVAILLEYNAELADASRVTLSSVAPAVWRKVGDQVRCGVIGAGQFAKGVLLLVLTAQLGVHLQVVCMVSGFTSWHVGIMYGVEYCMSDPDEVIVDPNVDALIIAMWHDQHARLTAAVIRAGKAVFVEKLLAIDVEGLVDVLDAVESSSGVWLMVGFNRWFALLSIRCREFFVGVAEPFFVSYRVNVGVVLFDSWVFDPVEGGGRILGEICHFVDMCAFLGGALPSWIFVEEVGRDVRSWQNVIVTLRLVNGGVGVIHYMTIGDLAVLKEYVEVFGGGRTAQFDNFRCFSMFWDNRRRRHRLFNQAKGHAEEMVAFVKVVRSGGAMLMDLSSIVAVIEVTFLIRQSLERGEPLFLRQETS